MVCDNFFIKYALQLVIVSPHAVYRSRQYIVCVNECAEHSMKEAIYDVKCTEDYKKNGEVANNESKLVLNLLNSGS